MVIPVTNENYPSLSENAAKRIALLKKRQDNKELMLRLAIEGGGCAGFQYRFSLTQEIEADDVTIHSHGETMVIDTTSLDFLGGAVVDYIEELGAAYFSVQNPGAASQCGCGTSFAPKM